LFWCRRCSRSLACPVVWPEIKSKYTFKSQVIHDYIGINANC
jgi:hypothetical protein